LKHKAEIVYRQDIERKTDESLHATPESLLLSLRQIGPLCATKSWHAHCETTISPHLKIAKTKAMGHGHGFIPLGN
jgi:hypothetical protein